MNDHLTAQRNLVSMVKLGVDPDTVSLLETPLLVVRSSPPPPPSILFNMAVINAPLGSSRLKDAWGERQLEAGTTFVMIDALFDDDKES